MCLNTDESNNEFFNDSLIRDGYVSWIVCSCKFSFWESLYFSEVNRLLIGDKLGKKDRLFVVNFFQ